MEDEVDAAKTQLFEAIAESDDTLLEKYLEGEEITTEEAFDGIRKGIADGLIIPVLAASAERMIGIDRLLDVIAGSAPSPSDLSRWISEEGDEIPCDPDGPFAAYAFKTYVDPYAGRLSVLRVVSGRCRSDEALTNPRTGSRRGWEASRTSSARSASSVSEAVAGDIIAVAKLRDTATFDTLCKPEKPMTFEPVELPEPTAAFAVGAKARGEEEKVFEAIRRIVDEDPSLNLERSEATGEDILAGLAQMHVELALERIEHRYGVEVEARPPKVPFMETITGSAQAQGRYKKQTGGRGQFGDARIELSPLPRGSGFEFENAIVGGAIPRQFIPAVEKGIIEAMTGGNIAGYPVVDVKVRLHDGAFHTVDSSENAFKVAGSMAFKNAIEKATPRAPGTLRQGRGASAFRAGRRHHGRPLQPPRKADGRRAARRAPGHTGRGAPDRNAHLRPRPPLHNRRTRQLPRRIRPLRRSPPEPRRKSPRRQREGGRESDQLRHQEQVRSAARGLKPLLPPS